MKKNIFLITFFTICIISSAQKIATFELQLPFATNGLDVPVSINLDEVTFIADSSLSLMEVRGNKSVPVPFQVSEEQHRILSWLVNTKNDQQKKTHLSIN